MTAAGNTLTRISALLLVSAVVWVGAAEAKTTEDREPAKTSAAKEADEAKAPKAPKPKAPKAKPEAKTPSEPAKNAAAEADVIANLDDLGQCGLFEEAKEKKGDRKARGDRERRKRAPARRGAKRSPGIGALFSGTERSAARPEHREVGYVARDRLSSRQVGRVMRAHRDEVAHCFMRASRRGSAGEVVLKLRVAPGGEVTSVRMGVEGASPRRVRRCLSSRVRSWRFPASGAASSIEFPFVFGDAD